MRLPAYLLLASSIVLFATNASASNVLLPSEGTTPNLGLAPQQPKASANGDDSSASQKNTNASGTNPSAGPSYVVSPSKQPTLMEKITTFIKPNEQPMSPVTPSAVLNSPAGKADIEESLAQVRQMNKITEDTEKKYANDPIWIKAQETKEALLDKAMANKEPHFVDDNQEQEPSTGPNTLSVAMGTNFTWSYRDAAAIHRALGYDAKQMQTNCQMRLTGVMMSDKTGVSFTVTNGQKTDINYTEAPKHILITSQAICNPPTGQLPKFGSVIIRTNGKYAVGIGMPATCPLPPANRALLKLQYNGNGDIACEYQR